MATNQKPIYKQTLVSIWFKGRREVFMATAEMRDGKAVIAQSTLNAMRTIAGVEPGVLHFIG